MSQAQLEMRRPLRLWPQAMGLSAFLPLFDYLYCLLASIVLTGKPLLGGALYLAAWVANTAANMFQAGSLKTASRFMRVSVIALMASSAVFALGLVLIYPLAVELPHLWVLFGVVLMTLMRPLASGRLNESLLRRQVHPVQRAFRLAELALLLCAVLAAALFLSQPTDVAWYVLGGYFIAAALEIFALMGEKEARVQPPVRLQTADQAAALEQANAYRAFQKVSGISIAALQVTMILSYTLIGTTAGDLLLCMGIAAVCTWLPSRLTGALLRSRRQRGRDPANLLLLGLALWLLSLLSMAQNILQAQSVWAFIALSFCTAGTTVAVHALQGLSAHMDDVVRFATGEEQPQDQGLPFARVTLSSLLGQMVALAGLSLMVFFGPDAQIGQLTTQPPLLVPALVLVAAALLSALRFPLEKRHLQKLRTFLMLKENGETNQPLQKQLEDVVIKFSRRRYGIKLLILVLHPFFPSRFVGKDKVVLDADVPSIFTCNHGEVYGPVVANLYLPFSFRTWVISEMVEEEQIADYIYTYTFKRQRWLPDRWKLPLARFVAPILAWIMASIECIPVYRNHPRDLINTFKMSAATMEAGDNLLIFPENPNDESLEKPGYVQEGIGPFFNGFVTVAQLYWRRTGKSPQFYPLYADKKQRTLTIGTPVRYDGNALPKDEQQRVADHLRREMLRMAGLDGAAGEDATC